MKRVKMRMVKKTIIVFALLLTLPMLVYPAPPEVGMTKTMEGLSGKDWHIRAETLERINSSKENVFTPEVNDKLLEVYRSEVDFNTKYVGDKMKKGISRREAEKEFTEEYLNKGYQLYFVNLNLIVSKIPNLKEDDLRVLLAQSPYPHYMLNQGKRVLGFLMSEANNSPDPSVRSNALSALSRWVNPNKASEDFSVSNEILLSSDEMGTLYELFRSIAINKNKKNGERLLSVYGLESFGPKALSVLEKIASTVENPFLKEETEKAIKRIRQK